MSRVEAAIRSGSCVLAFGGKVLREDQVLAELRRREAIPAFVLGGDAVSPAAALTAETLAPATSRGGGLLVLIEPDAGMDGRALNELGSLLSKARNKPRLLVVARSFNPFLLPMSMRLLKFEQDKKRAADFMAVLPVPTGPAAGAGAPGAPKKKKKAKAGPPAPRVQFSGRYDQVPALAKQLRGGGPLVLVGAPGVGRQWLYEQALVWAPKPAPEPEAGAEPVEPVAPVEPLSELTRLPDFVIGRGCAFDSLAARLAELSGDEDLQKALKSRDVLAPTELVERLVKALDNEALAGKVMLIRKLHLMQGRDGYVFNQERIGLLIKALLTSSYAPRLVFTTTRAPLFFKEGQGQGLPVIKVGGLKGRELYDIFDSYQAGEVPRDKMGEVYNQTGGHPMATRSYAVAWRDSGRRDKLIEDKRFLKMGTADNIEAFDKYLRQRVDKLKDDLKNPLILVGHFPIPVSGQELAGLGLGRKERITLASRGLLDALPHGETRHYYVHELVKAQLGGRALSDFDITATVAEVIQKRAKGAEGLEQLALNQAANRMFVSARRLRGRVDVGYRDNDPIIEAVRILLRMRTPRFDVAEQRLNEALILDPGNTELRTLKIEVLSHKKDSRDEVDALIKETEELCPTPEFFHAMVYRLASQRKGKAKAVVMLDRACAAFPSDAGLRRRKGTLLSELKRYADAETALREAMDLEPMAPEAYSRLGEVLLAQGQERWKDAEDAIRHALEQEPDRGVHKARLGRLLRYRAMVAEAAEGETLRAEAKELLEQSLKGLTRSGWPFLELAQLLLEIDGADMERAEWCVKKARKIGGGKDVLLKIVAARIQARRGKEAPAEAAIQRALTGRAELHQATAALGELYALQGKIFAAAPQFARAIELSPEGAAERSRFEREHKRLTALIASGQAVEIEKAAEAARAGELQAQSQGSEVKQVSDRGNTVVRRRGGQSDVVVQGSAAEDAAQEPAAEAAPEPVAEAVAEEPAAEAAPEPVAEAAPEPVAEEPAAEAVAQEPAAEAAPEPVVEPVPAETAPAAEPPADAAE